MNELFSKDIIELIIIVLGAGIPVSLYVARLHWKINRLERDFNNNPLLVLSKTWEENQGGTESNPTQLKLTVSDHGEPVIEKMFTPVTQTLQPGQSTEFSVLFTISGDITFDYQVEVVSQ